MINPLLYENLKKELYFKWIYSTSSFTRGGNDDEQNILSNIYVHFKRFSFYI